MVEAVKLLAAACETSSQGKIAAELKISKSSVCLLLKEKYPKPEKMYKKILAALGNEDGELIGVECLTKDLKELMREIG